MKGIKIVLFLFLFFLVSTPCLAEQVYYNVTGDVLYQLIDTLATFGVNVSVTNGRFLVGDWYSGTIIVTEDIDDEHIEGDLNTYVDIAGDTMVGNLSILANLSVDSGLLFADSTNDKVGIGTTTPESELDVNGNIRTDEIGFTETAGIKMKQYVSSWNNLSYIMSSSYNAALGDYVNYSHGGNGVSTKWFIVSQTEGFLFPNGDVGIGTTSPSYQLEVADTGTTTAVNLSDILYVDASNNRVGIGTSSMSSELDVRDTESNSDARLTIWADGSQYCQFGTNTGETFIVTQSKDLIFYTMGSESGRWKSDGRFVIGATVAQQNLTVLGNSDISGFGIFGGVVSSTGYTDSDGFTTANSERLCWDGSGSSNIFDCTGSPGDYAEWYKVKGEKNFGAGDVVVEDGLVLGVVSTAPNDKIGEDVFPEEIQNTPLTRGKTSFQYEGDTYVAVAISGRVPVLVEGKVEIGDRLTSVGNGLARKLSDDESGYVIGIALEDGEGTVLAKVEGYEYTCPAEVKELRESLCRHFPEDDICG